MRRFKKWKGLLFVLPSLVGVIIFYIVPFMGGLSYCFTIGIQEKKFVGFANFISLFRNEAYRLAVKNTVMLMGIALLLLCSMAILLALIIEEHLSKVRFLQSWVLIPVAIPTATMVLVWNDLLMKEGILSNLVGCSVDWLDSLWAPYIMVGIMIWKNIGYDILLVISTLLTLPKEYEESASLEGANWLKIAWYIKLPQLIPMLFFMVIISLFNCFKIFREIYLLRGDYPSEQLYLLQHFMNNHFINLNYPMVTAAAFMMYVIIFMIIGGAAKWQQHYIESYL